MTQAAGGELITDDFAPVSLYDTIGKGRRSERMTSLPASLLRRHRAQIGDDALRSASVILA